MLSGECYCGSVAYQIEGDIDLIYCCHCHVDSRAAWTSINDGKQQFPQALPPDYVSRAASG